MIFGIWNPRWWNPESKFDLESGIQRVQNPEFTFLTEYFLKKVREVLKALQPISFYSSCSFQNSLYVQLTRKRFQNENLFKKWKCCQNKETQEYYNAICKGEKPLQKQCFWKTKAEIQWFRLILESGIQKSGIRKTEGQKPESRGSESRVQLVGIQNPEPLWI